VHGNLNSSGQASGENAKAVGMLAEFMAEKGWSFVAKELKPNPAGTGKAPSGKRMYSTSSTTNPPGNKLPLV
jgi:hypothetical protein